MTDYQLQNLSLGDLITVYYDPLGRPYVYINDLSNQTQMLLQGNSNFRGGINFCEGDKFIIGQVFSGKLRHGGNKNYALVLEMGMFAPDGIAISAYGGVPLFTINSSAEIRDYNDHLMISPTTLGPDVRTSSLTSVGTLSSLTVAGDLTVDTDTLKVDSTNNRVGVNQASPTCALDVTGSANISTNLTVGGYIDLV